MLLPFSGPAEAEEIVPPDSLAIELNRYLGEARRNPLSGETYLKLAELYRRRGNLVAARASAEEGMRLGLSGSDSSRAVLILADIALQQGRSNEAAQRLQDLLERSSASTAVMRRLAQLRWDDRFRTEALVLGMEAASQDPGSDTWIRWLAEGWKETGRLDMALNLHEWLVARDRGTDEDLFQIGYLSQRLGHGQAALDAYLQLLQRRPMHPEGNYNVSLLLLALADTSAAVEHLERAIGADSEMQPAYFDLAILWMRLGKIDRARRVLLDFCTTVRSDSSMDAYVREILRTLSEEEESR